MSEHQILPVAGYRPQSKEVVDLVNKYKRIEESLLRGLDQLTEDTKLSVDKRWLAIGRTHLEQAFMAINRSIFKPSRIDDV